MSHTQVRVITVDGVADSARWLDIIAGTGIDLNAVETGRKITNTIEATGAAPTGTAGGDLSGTYPDPTVAKVDGQAPGTFGKARLGDAAQSDARTALGLGSAAYTSSGDYDAAGAATAALNSATALVGRLIGVQVLTTGTSYTPTSGTTTIVVDAYGGGGGGGGTTTVEASSAAGGGGAAGGQVTKRYTGIGAGPYTYAVGQGGSGGNNAGGNGGNGTDSTFNDGTTLVTAKGGNGGQGMAATAAAALSGGGTCAIGTGGDANGAGAPGGYGQVISATLAVSGQGGSGEYGAGGAPKTAAGVGTAGTGAGCGGSGGLVVNGSAAVGGGAGKNGQIVIYEYT